MSLEKAREFVDDVKIGLMVKQPFYYFMLNSMEIKYIDEDRKDAGMGMFGHTLVLYKSSFEDSGVKKFPIQIVKHEILHLVLEHSVRITEVVKKLRNDGVLNDEGSLWLLANLAMDAKVNNLLQKEGENISWGVNGRAMWSQDDIEKCSVEELVCKFAEQNSRSIPCHSFNDLLKELEDETDDVQKGKGGQGQSDGKEQKQTDSTGAEEKEQEEKKTSKGVTLQKGDERFKEMSKEDAKELVKKIVCDNICKAKVAGTGNGNTLRIIEDNLLKPKKQKWYEIFRSQLKSVMVKSRISDWRIQSRRLPGIVAGTRDIKKPKMCVCIDVSGSIGTEDYSRFIREVLNFHREGEVTAIFWDDGIVSVRKVKNKQQLIRDVHGGGGTQLAPVFAKHKMNIYDVVVVLTDGYVYDREQIEAELKKVKCTKVLLTTGDKLKGFDVSISMRNDD